MSGVDLTTVKELLGHKTLTMTLRYAHLAPSHKVNAVRVLEDEIGTVTEDSADLLDSRNGEGGYPERPPRHLYRYISSSRKNT